MKAARSKILFDSLAGAKTGKIPAQGTAEENWQDETNQETPVAQVTERVKKQPQYINSKI